jgi:hypothetical protein
MSEWLKEHAWKACVGATLPWVRIPLSPPAFARLNCERASAPQASESNARAGCRAVARSAKARLQPTSHGGPPVGTAAARSSTATGRIDCDGRISIFVHSGRLTSIREILSSSLSRSTGTVFQRAFAPHVPQVRIAFPFAQRFMVVRRVIILTVAVWMLAMRRGQSGAHVSAGRRPLKDADDRLRVAGPTFEPDRREVIAATDHANAS